MSCTPALGKLPYARTHQSRTLNSSLSNKVDETILRNFTLFPNPANTSITLEADHLEKENTVWIYNSNGQEIIKQQIEKNKTEVDIQNLPIGIYFVKLVSNLDLKTISTRKVVIAD